MSPADRFWLRANARATGLTPEMAAALRRAFEILRDNLPPTIVEDLIQRGDVEGIFRLAMSPDVLERAFIPVRERVRRTIESGLRYTIRDLPKAGKIDGVLTVSFDVLNPRVVDAIRDLDTRVVRRLQDETREVVRAFVENGIRDGVNPRTTARRLPDVIGLSPDQVQQVRNFRQALEDRAAGKAGGRDPFSYTRRNKRFDRMIREGRMTPERIDRAVDDYSRSRINLNRETIARTATLDSFKRGQHLAFQDAVDNGLVPPGFEFVKTWTGVLDQRERPEHVAMEKETVPLDAPYSNGEVIPGQSTYNCRCLSHTTLRRIRTA